MSAHVDVVALAAATDQTAGVSAKYGQRTRKGCFGEEEAEVERDPEWASQAYLGFRLASAAEDGKITIWDLMLRRAIATLDSHVAVVRGLDYSEHQATLLSSSRDKTFVIEETHTLDGMEGCAALEGTGECVLLGKGVVCCSWRREWGATRLEFDHSERVDARAASL
jgi:hypothetical protein